MSKLNLFCILCLSICSYNVDAMSKFHLPVAMPWNDEQFEEHEVFTTILNHDGEEVRSNIVPYRVMRFEKSKRTGEYDIPYENCLTILNNVTRIGFSKENFADLHDRYTENAKVGMIKGFGEENNGRVNRWRRSEDLKIDKIFIPNSVIEIGSGAFAAIPTVSEIHIGSGVENIAHNAFPNGVRQIKDCIKVYLKNGEQENSPRVHKLRMQILKSFPDITNPNTTIPDTATPETTIPNITISNICFVRYNENKPKYYDDTNIDYSKYLNE